MRICLCFALLNDSKPLQRLAFQDKGVTAEPPTLLSTFHGSTVQYNLAMASAYYEFYRGSSYVVPRTRIAQT